jgi:lipopolysaccharide biosynthesis regulator YciM
MIDFINGNYQAALESWQKVIQQDDLCRHELRSWVEKANAKLNHSN